jgi:hypothetical protein
METEKDVAKTNHQERQQLSPKESLQMTESLAALTTQDTAALDRYLTDAYHLGQFRTSQRPSGASLRP